ncbi:hypothetical protein [Cohnella panacarvi]|uniref:hypothetical protein n=1 Tax=Cohnella panacarvi TaxID=400776 RepID=UPI00047EC255|nr:hypothetical protein [Cohnella panacarvi]
MIPHSKKRRGIRLGKLTAILVAVWLLAMTAGCIGDPASETIIITEDEQSGGGVEIGEAFRVSTIYPLPALASSGLSVLGWTSGEAVVGYFSENGSLTVPSTVGLQLLSPPYEKPEPLMNDANSGTSLISLSPDGRLIAEWTTSPDGAYLTLVPLDSRPAKPVAAIPIVELTLLSRQIQWSSNSRFLSYMEADGNRTQQFMVVCDARDGTVQKLPLHGYNTDGNVSVRLSEDGNAVLLDDGKLVAMAKRNADGSFEVQYDHPSGRGGSTWMDSDRFVFLGSDDTLFQYDARNGELSVLLEKVTGFSLSPDRQAIAYTLSDKEAIYAGRLQGNNVLYQTPVYQGVVPDRMVWSLNGGALLVDGGMQPSRSTQVVAPAPAAQAGERLQTFIIAFQ